MADGDPHRGRLRELREICRTTTGDTVSRDLERARLLAAGVRPDQRPEATRLLRMLEHLEAWLRDR